jgi:hypothetical protein
MTPLSLELFTGAAYDVERTQYQVLAGLKRARDAFSKNYVYPHLGRLVKLYKTLNTVLERSEAFRTKQTGEITGVDLDAESLIYEWPELDRDQMADVKELIRWSLPHVQDAIEEGRAVYEFVEDSLYVEEVGIVPSYVEEGYMMVPDREQDVLHVMRYHLSIFTNADERYRSLRTVHCKSVPQPGVDLHPSSVKLELMEENQDLPNPATYFFDTEEVFPYERTMLPVVKRRLMRHLHEQGGVA